IDINAPVADNIKAVAKAKNKDVEDVVAVLLDRPRHETLIEEIRATGARIKLITDGDVAGAINTAFDETGVDILFGIGGAPAGVISAVALKSLGGELQGKLKPSKGAEIARCTKMGLHDMDKVCKKANCVSGADTNFAATALT